MATRKSTQAGVFCAPQRNGRNGTGTSTRRTCYSHGELIDIIQAYNTKNRDRIAIPANASTDMLWHLLDDRLQNECSTEWCWMKKLDRPPDDGRIFLPVAPEGGQYGWLSTLDIKNVLAQKMQEYPEFLALGPVAIDFCSVKVPEVCNLNIKAVRATGKTKIGIVFNTDPSTRGGQHWICMFIDISPNELHDWSINYFDSFGMAPLAPEIRVLIEKLKKQNPMFKLELNCSDVSGICTRSVRQQRKNSECGVYCIDFIVERLSGRTWDDLLTNGETDESINKKRSKFFRPRDPSK